MLKKLKEWFISRKIKNAAGELEAKGVSITKLALIIMALLKSLEAGSAQYGHPIVAPPFLYAVLGSLAGIAARNGMDRNAPNP